MKKFKFLEHTADIKFRAFGKTLEECFENSVLAVSDVLSRGEKIKSVKVKEKQISGNDNESILYNLLEEVIYLFDAENFIVSKAEITFNKKTRKLKVEFHGDNTENYSGLDHVKSVTYHEMFVKKEKNLWTAQVVLDI